MCLSSGKSQTALDIPLNQSFIQKGESVLLISFVVVHFCAVCLISWWFVCSVTDEYNESLVFSPDDRRLLYSIREPIVNRVFSSSRQRGFASKSVNVPQPQNRSWVKVDTVNQLSWSTCLNVSMSSAASGCVSARDVGMPAWWSTVGLHSSSMMVPLLQSAWVKRISSARSFLNTEMSQ